MPFDRRGRRFGDDRVCALGVRRIKMDQQQYIVGGRSFGTLFFLVLLAGEIYTTFTFLGIAGLSYSQGAPGFYMSRTPPLDLSSPISSRRPSGRSAKTRSADRAGLFRNRYKAVTPLGSRSCCF